MEVRSIHTTESSQPNWIRLTAEVVYDDSAHKPEWYWFEVPSQYEASIDKSGTPWLSVLLPLAATLKEPLRIVAPISSVLYENSLQLLDIWKSWYPSLRPVSIEAPLAEDDCNASGSRSAAFFSGGVDSFFTVLANDAIDFPLPQIPITDLLLVWGFDVPLNNPAGFRRMNDLLQAAADLLDKRLVPVATNLREARWKATDWAFLSHGSALAGVAHVLGRMYDRVLISSTYTYQDLTPWGSHPLTDPLLSSSRTKIIHFGGGYTRLEKTRCVAGSDVALRSLHVCFRSKSGNNCGSCAKCYRTMLTLDLLGALDRCSTFQKQLDINRVANIYSRDYGRVCLIELEAFAKSLGKNDIAARLARSFRYSARLERRLSLARKLDTWFEAKPFLWRWTGALTRRVQAAAII